MSPLPGKLPKSSAPAERITPGAVVEYEQHGKPILGVVTGERKDQWVIVNEAGQELAIAGTRLYLLPDKAALGDKSRPNYTDYLAKLRADALASVEKIDLSELWELTADRNTEISVTEFTELYFNNNQLLSHLAIRRALIADKIFFKRKKVGYEPRPAAVVEELKVQARVETEKEKKREILKTAILSALDGKPTQFPDEIFLIEDLAVFGTKAEQAKDANALLNDILDLTGLELPGRADDKAFLLLVKLGIFDPHENLLLYRFNRPIGFHKDVDADMERQIAALSNKVADTSRKDLTHLTVVTIDPETTMDIDDGLSIETTEDGYRVGVHITDVASGIEPGSLLEREAFSRGTSIYFADGKVPMLPQELSQDRLSLVAGQSRLALSYLVDFDKTFNIVNRNIVRSVIKVSDRMNYEEVDRVLYDEVVPEQHAAKRDEVLSLLWQVTCALEERRLRQGASQFNRREMQAQLLPDGRVELVSQAEDTPSHKLVGEMMILANETSALFAKQNNVPIIFRSQEAPEQDAEAIERIVQHIPDGPAKDYARMSFMKRSLTTVTPAPHFSLGLPAYTQATSPIRRAGDLITQRQIVHFLEHGKVYYSPDKLEEEISLITTALDEANYIQRNRNRYWLMQYLRQENIRELVATVMKVDGTKLLAEVDVIFMSLPFTPSPLLKKPLKQGDIIRLSIARLDPRNDTLRLEQIL